MPIMSSNRIVYVEVDQDVYEAARERCNSHVQNMSALCRVILNRAAQEALERPLLKNLDKAEALEVSRLRTERAPTTKRLRFVADKEQYEIAKRRLRSRGLSVGVVINEGLEEFALHGKIA